VAQGDAQDTLHARHGPRRWGLRQAAAPQREAGDPGAGLKLAGLYFGRPRSLLIGLSGISLHPL